MTPPDEMPDDSTLARIAAGDGSVSEDVTYAQALAMEVLRLRERVARAETVRDDAGDAYDVLVRRVWEAATGDTHEGPASVDVLLEAVAGLRARVDGAEAKHDALRAAVRECHALERVAADPPPRQALAAAIAADDAWERVVALVGEG